LIARKAREGNMRAMEILARHQPIGAGPVAAQAEAEPPVAETPAIDDILLRRVA
jgi:hypothetical protein